MLKKLNQVGWHRRWVSLLGAGILLLLTLCGGCDKNNTQTNKTAATQPDPLGGDPATVAQMVSHLTTEEKALRSQQLKQLQTFAAEKEKQSEKLAATVGEKVSPEAGRFFDAAKKGDNGTVRSMFDDFMKRHRQYAGSSSDNALDTSYWAPELEVDLAYECVIPIDPKSIQFFVDDTINSIPPGSIYFGGTDSGRGLITAFTKSHADADPFFTITQNALADGSYLTYLRQMYGEKIRIPSADDSAKCFSDYLTDARERYDHDQSHPGEPRKIKSGEDVKVVNGSAQVSGQVAVMEISGRLVKTIFDQNPTKEFYVEESFPLEWMYSYLEPHGPILKLNRNELTEIPEATVAKDREYWQTKVNEKLGSWLTPETSVETVADFAGKVFARKDLSGFTGDQRYLESVFAQKMVSKLRSSIGGMYDWRSQHAGSAAEKERMTKEADLALRQSFALCPYSPEAVFRYVNLLAREGRTDDALRVASVAWKVAPNDQGLEGLVKQLHDIKSQMSK